MRLWIRAIIYMLVVGAAWLVLLPSAIVYAETRPFEIQLRTWQLTAFGLSLLVVGAALALWAGFVLVYFGKGTPLPLDPPVRLVTNGPYGYVRNPQGIAMTLMAIGEALIINSTLIWFLPLLTVLYLEGLVGPLERGQLFRDFGQVYREYEANVGKWLPRQLTSSRIRGESSHPTNSRPGHGTDRDA